MANKKDVYVPTVGEEIANTVTHGVMSLVALVALPFAAVWAYVHDPNPVTASVSVSIFVISIFLMFLASTLYHSMNPASKHKAVFHILDHIFIYVAIAGSYTPIALSVIGGWQGIFITILQWAMVLFGIFYKSLSRNSIPAISLTIYLVMGCLLPAAFRAAGLNGVAGADRRGRCTLHARRLVLCPAGVSLPPHGMASADQPCGRGAFHRDRVFPLLTGSALPCVSA